MRSRTLAHTWQNDVAAKEIALMGAAETQEEARKLEASGAGKASMDGLRAKAGEMEKAERDSAGHAQRRPGRCDRYDVPRHHHRRRWPRS